MINGKDLKTVLKEIAAPCEVPPKKLDGKYDYYDIGEYEKRLQSVVGRDNYTTSYSIPQFITLPTNQVIVSVNCNINLLNEDCTIAFVASGVGTNEITLNKNKDNYLYLSNVGYNTQLAAFKSACKDLNIFSLRSSKPANTSPKETSAETIKERKERFFIQDKIEIISEDKHMKKPVYKLTAHLCVGSQAKECESYLLFYPNQYNSFSDRLNQFISFLNEKPQTFITLTVKETKKDPNSFVVCGMEG